MRRVVSVLSGLLITVFVTLPANAQESAPTPDVTGDGDAISGLADRRGHVPLDRSSAYKQGATSPESSPPIRVPRPEVRWDPTGYNVCYEPGSQAPSGPPSDAVQELAAYELSYRVPRCGGFLTPIPILSPGAAAQMVWRDQMKLPAPEPYIAPGKAITGLAAFLEIRGPRTRTETFNVFGYALTITATVGGYDVDWGDGTWSRGVTSSGGPWPKGDVRHVYTDMGKYTVRVVERWSGTWSVAGGGGGAVDGELGTEGTIPSFPVDQLQAVRNR